MPNIYRTFTQTDLDNKASYATSSTQNEKVNTIVNKFITLFKQKHL